MPVLLAKLHCCYFTSVVSLTCTFGNSIRHSAVNFTISYLYTALAGNAE